MLVESIILTHKLKLNMKESTPKLKNLLKLLKVVVVFVVVINLKFSPSKRVEQKILWKKLNAHTGTDQK